MLFSAVFVNINTHNFSRFFAIAGAQAMPFDGSSEQLTDRFNIESDILSMKDEMIELRRDLHRHPQTGFEETYAHERITTLLQEWGLKYDVMAKTGIVVTLEGRANKSGRVVGLRADMDALNIHEESGVAWESEYDGKMHACGHDGHMVTLLSALKHLKDNPDFDGTVKFVFQPAEEGVGGAELMLEERLLERHRMDAFYAIHNWPDLPLGKAAVHTGPVMASNTNFRILLEGKSSHGALPDQGTNSVLVGSKLVVQLDSLHQEFAQTHPEEKFVLSTCAYEAGDMSAMSALPDDAKMAGTIRTYNKEIKDALPQRITQMAHDFAHAHGMSAKVDFPNICSPTVNNPDKAAISRDAVSKVIGADNVEWNATPAMTAEDFGEFSDKLPISYIWMGQAVPNQPDSPHNKGLHNSGFDFNDDLIPVGAQYFVNVVKAEMPLNCLDCTTPQP